MSDDNYELKEILESERMMFDKELREEYVSKADLREWGKENMEALLSWFRNGDITEESLIVQYNVYEILITRFCSEAK